MSLTQIEKLPADFNPWSYRELKFAYPFLFFTLSAGALSGSQALKATIVAPYIKNEKLGTGIFWRTMFIHTGIIIIWNLLVLSWNPTREFIISLVFNGANTYETLANGMAYNIRGGGYLLYLMFLLIVLTSIVGLMRAMADVLLETKNYPSATLYVIEVSILLFCILIYPLALNYSFSSMNLLTISIYLLFLLRIYFKSLQKPVKKYTLMILFLIGVMFAEFVLQVHKQDLLESVLAGLLASFLAYILVCHKEFFDFIKNMKSNRKRRKVIIRRKKQVIVQKRLEAKARLMQEEQQRRLAQEKEDAAIKAMEEQTQKQQEEFWRAQQPEEDLVVAVKEDDLMAAFEQNQEDFELAISQYLPSEQESEETPSLPTVTDERKTQNKPKKKRKRKKSTAKKENQTS